MSFFDSYSGVSWDSDGQAICDQEDLNGFWRMRCPKCHGELFIPGHNDLASSVHCLDCDHGPTVEHKCWTYVPDGALLVDRGRKTPGRGV